MTYLAGRFYTRPYHYSLTPTCPPRARATSAAPTTKPTITTATTVAFSNSAPAAKSSINSDNVRDLPEPSSTTVLISLAAEINPTRATVISAVIVSGKMTRLKVSTQVPPQTFDASSRSLPSCIRTLLII